MRQGWDPRYKIWVEHGEPAPPTPPPTALGQMQHLVDGGAWKIIDTKYPPDFAKEPRNVRLGLAADGFNPFGNLSQAYSMWPDIDVYLRPLIEDLKVLWDRKGVETIDVASGQKFNMRAMVLWTINDFPARSSLSGWSGQGYKACPTCNEDTPSVRVLSKTAYVGHKRFLKKPHKWRRSLAFNGPKPITQILLKKLGCNPGQLDKIANGGVTSARARIRTLAKMLGIRSACGWPNKNGKCLKASVPVQSQELFALATGTSWTPIPINSCVVDGVRWSNHRVVDAPPRISLMFLRRTLILLVIEDGAPSSIDLADLMLKTLSMLMIVVVVKYVSRCRRFPRDGGGDDRPPYTVDPPVAGAALLNKGKKFLGIGIRKPNLGEGAGRLNTATRTRNLFL
ncbi:hypothetical protein Tco_0858644 [Tanacetum coccineum]|uniref:Uncharacterized protein n=1 Tax=Tanacetum coccineum TaxID=301880 RepID=A0ABQ5BCN8_9ASTR